MSQSHWGNCWLALEDWRLRRHFRRVETILLRRDVSHLAPHLQAAREKQIERLRDYTKRSIFPRNDGKFIYTPCFIDKDGRECAVAHLVMGSGQDELVRKIALNANYAYVPQMRLPELEDWAAETGLSQEELALIQPGYWSSFWELLPMAQPLWFIGFFSIGFNVVQIMRKKMSGWGSWVLLVFAIPLFLFSLLCILEGASAEAISRDTVDTGQHLRELASADVMPLMLGGLVSLLLAGVSIGLPIYRLRAFPSVKGKKRRGKRI